MPRNKVCVICSKSHQNSLSKCCSPVCTRKHTSNLKKLKEEKIKIKKEKVKIKKAFTRSTLIKEADRVFSLYIRERDRGLPCVTCGAKWTDTHQCGHFASRRHLNTRWHEKNAHSQCPRCNMFQGGEQFKHGLAIDQKYGAGTAEQIMRFANDADKMIDEEIYLSIGFFYHELDRMLIDYSPKRIYLTK